MLQRSGFNYHSILINLKNNNVNFFHNNIFITQFIFSTIDKKEKCNEPILK